MAPRTRILVGGVAVVSLVAIAVAAAVALRGGGATYAVMGRQMYLGCEGSGSPVVVLEAGLGGDHHVWDGIVPAIAAVTRVCAYDRAGIGRSEPADGSRTALTVVDDLANLLDVADVPGPYVLAGHSFGGLTSERFAEQHPDLIAGLVLIEPSHPRDGTRWQEVLTAEQWADVQSLWRDTPEPIDFVLVVQDPEPLGPIPPVPLTVITATKSLDVLCDRGLPCEALASAGRDHSAEYVALSATGRRVEAPTGHNVHLEDPKLVIDEVIRVVEAVRLGA
jgi:pimeloyl-ACP methyl ester carboxylesterase